MSSPDYSAEIERMLGGAGDNPTPGAPPPGGDPPSGQVPNPALGEHGHAQPHGVAPPREDPQLIAMRDQLNAAQRQIDELRQQRAPLPTDSGGAMPGVQAQNVDQLKKNLEDAFLKDPGGTLLSMAAYMQGENAKLVAAEIAKATGGIKTDVTGGNVAAFRSKMLADPVLAPAVDEFDKLIRDVGDKLTPGNMNKELDALASTALGNTFRNRLPGQRQIQPPAWGGGSTASSDTGQQPSTGTRLSTEQEEYVRTMAEMGVPKDVINERLKNWDYEGGFTKQ